MRETLAILLRFLFRLTMLLSSGLGLVVLLMTLLTYFFPDPTGAEWQAGQHAELAKVPLRTTPQEEPVRRAIQLPAAPGKVAQQTTSPAADVQSLPASKRIPDPSAQQDRGARSNADASEQQRSGSAQVPEPSTEIGGRILPISATIDNPRNPRHQELPQVAPGALSEQNERASAADATVISQSSSNRSVTSQSDSSTVATTAADDDTKITPAGQAPSGAPIQQDKPAAAESTAHGSREPPQPTTQNSNRSKLTAAEHISIHYRRTSAPARAEAQHLASWLASSGFGMPRLLTTEHGTPSPVVRYFFKEDAEGVTVLVRALQSRDGSWRVEDCRSYRHKPALGTIEVWPHT
jgi:hypothetical protein